MALGAQNVARAFEKGAPGLAIQLSYSFWSFVKKDIIPADYSNNNTTNFKTLILSTLTSATFRSGTKYKIYGTKIITWSNIKVL